jgi:multiple sugar transport system permease protein
MSGMIKRKNNRMIFLFLAPAMTFYAIVFLYPVLRTSVMSLFKVETVSQPVSQWEFYGLGNYVDLSKAGLFAIAMGNFLKILFIGGAAVLSMALVFAVALTSGVRFKRFSRSVIYLPNVISAVAMGTMWLNYVYNMDYGLFNGAITAVGGSPVPWTGPGMLFWSMLIAYGFGMVGYHMLIFVSGIERISVDFYEAAGIEGANVFHKFFHITLPMLKGVMRSNVVIWTISVTGFFVWGQLFSPVNLSNETVTPVNYMYELVFGSSSSAASARNTGMGAAIGVIMALIVIAASMLAKLITRNDDAEL